MIHRAESLGNNTEMTEGISGAMIGVIVEETLWWNTIFLLSYSAVIILNRESEVHVRYLVDNDFTSVVELAPVHSLAIKNGYCCHKSEVLSGNKTHFTKTFESTV